MQQLKKGMTKWPWIWLAAVVLAAGVYFALQNTMPQYAWMAVAGIVAVSLALVLIWHFILRKRLQQSVVEMGLSLNEELSGRMDSLDLPYVIINRQGKILWQNEAFREALEAYGTEGQRKAGLINEIFPQIEWDTESALYTEPRRVYLGDKIYAVHQRQSLGKTHIAAILLTDETEHIATRKTLEKERGVAGVLYVDNYEDLLKRTESAQHSLLGALIEQQIQKYFQEAGGIVCKTDRDRYYVFLNHESLEKCRSDKFSLLNEVKKIKAGNSRPVTLSLAFGEGGNSYGENLNMAQIGMDLALGRGGDQAVIKTPDNTEYFGGKAQGEAGQARVRARVKAQTLREMMSLHENVYIMGHSQGDNDSFGASVAIYRAAMSLHLHAHIILDTVSFSVRPFWERFQASAEYPRDMFLTGSEALEQFRDNSMIVVVDTNRAAMTECPALLEKTDQIVVFDHHRQMEGGIAAQFNYVEPYSSSACEMVTEILQYFGEGIYPRPLEAEAIYSGILVDTNSFNDRTSSRTFEAAAFLKRSGADLVEVKKMLRENFKEYKAKAGSLQAAEITDDGFAFAVCPSEGLDSPTIVGSQVANELLNINGVKASFVFTEVEGYTFISARSIDEVNVQLIMERMGGGGHLGAAGVQRPGSAAEAMREVKETLRAMQEEGAI